MDINKRLQQEEGLCLWLDKEGGRLEQNIFRLGIMAVLFIVLGLTIMGLKDDYPNVMRDIENFIEHVTGDMH